MDICESARFEAKIPLSQASAFSVANCSLEFIAFPSSFSAIFLSCYPFLVWHYLPQDLPLVTSPVPDSRL